MLGSLRRPLVVAGAFALVAAIGANAAMAAQGKGRFGARAVVIRGTFGPLGGGGGFAGPIGPGGPAFAFGGENDQGDGAAGFAFGKGGHDGPGGAPGGPGRPGGAGILGADVLTPAASFLGISVSALATDLKGGKTLAQEATAKGKTAADLIAAIKASEKTVLDAENAAGWITDAQETAVLADLTDQITNLVNNGPPVPPTKGTQTGPLETAATYLGITVADLQAALKSGKTLADEATANGKTVDGLVAALVAPAKTKLDASVTAGDITAAQEQTILADLTQHVTDFVNNTKPTGKQTATLSRLLIRH